MYLKHLQLVNFKNYEEAFLDLEPGINCFVGANGSGKTNLLDAIHYLSMCKSFLHAVDRQNIRFDQGFFSVMGQFDKDNEAYAIHAALKVGAKKVFKINKKEYEKLADHIGLFPSVVISPYDKDLISEGSELRRKWIDAIISQSNRNYLYTVQRYVKVLEQRNALLKNMHNHGLFDRESIEVWDEQLIDLGNKIHADRKAFLEEFIPVFIHHYNQIGLEEDQVNLSYKSQLNDVPFDQLLKESERKDYFSQYTTVGIHRDDLIFTIFNHPVKKFGSQGQQKSFVIALRLAQYEWLSKQLKVKPILLLDDIFDKLDQHRVQRLIDLVSSNFFGQVVLTDTDEKRMVEVLENNALEGRVFIVNKGSIELSKTVTYERIQAQ